ncbi:MAG: SDR family NAD(P)-dependent oxidoreductase [Pseudomonadota bacterium]
MAETIVICGYGMGISDAVARRFAKEGYRVAIVARNAERLNRAAQKLAAEKIDVKAFPCDVSDVDAVRKLVADVRASFGPIKVLHWNAYSGGAGDLKTASADDCAQY